MNAFRCACGFAAGQSEDFTDHLLEAFDRDTGTDGREHVEIIAGGQDPRSACACGFQAGNGAELDSHLLLMLTPPGNIGIDGEMHVLVHPGGAVDHPAKREVT